MNIRQLRIQHLRDYLVSLLRERDSLLKGVIRKHLPWNNVAMSELDREIARVEEETNALINKEK